MTERPILFSAPMVRALLSGTKTQTRRALRVQPPASTVQVSTWHHPDERPHFYAWTREEPANPSQVFDGMQISDWPPMPCPYGQPGDRLWVRETWARTIVHPGTELLVYREGDNRTDYGGPWRPGIHMPRAASRITLEVTGVRVERLQSISEADAIAEGVQRTAGGSWLPGPCDHPEWAYHQLWDQINGDGAWAANPWVWVVEFKVVKP